MADGAADAGEAVVVRVVVGVHDALETRAFGANRLVVGRPPFQPGTFPSAQSDFPAGQVSPHGGGGGVKRHGTHPVLALPGYGVELPLAVGDMEAIQSGAFAQEVQAVEADVVGGATRSKFRRDLFRGTAQQGACQHHHHRYTM